MEVKDKIRMALIFLLEGLMLCAAVVCALLPGFPRRVLLPVVTVINGVIVVVATVAGMRIYRRFLAAREKMLYYDKFTNLPNERMFQEDLERMPAGKGHVYLTISLGEFHQLNFLFGLDAGGRTIKRLIPPLKSFAEKHAGFAYRLSLDRFAFLLATKSPKKFLASLEKLIADLERINVEDEHAVYSYHYTFKYGVYFLSDAEKDEESLRRAISVTDSAVSRFQGNNRSEHVVFDDQNRPDWELVRILANDVHRAWESREFVPYYQLVYDLKTGRPCGAEILTRWQHPTKGLMTPADFLPVMENEGLIMDLDLYMAEEACKRIKGWIDAELVTIPLSVNISKLNIHRQDFVKHLEALVASYDIPPVLLELEMTEAVLLYEKNEEFLELASQLHNRGFTLTIDNFAANDFNSINLLRDLPIGAIKLSTRFFSNVAQCERDRIFVQNVVRMAREMNVKVVVMGVEKQEEAALFNRMGCSQGQGYFFSRPMSNEDFEKLIF